MGCLLRETLSLTRNHASGRVTLPAELPYWQSYPSGGVTQHSEFSPCHHSVCLFREKSEVVRCPRLQVIRAIYPSLSCSPSRSSTNIHPLHPLFPIMSEHAICFRSCHPHSLSSHGPFLIFIMLSYPRSFFFSGQKFALMEEKVVLSSILRHFTVHSIQTTEDIKKSGELILRSIEGIWVKLELRQH